MCAIIGGFYWFKKSLKYSLHLDTISFSSLRMFLEGSLMEKLEFDLAMQTTDRLPKYFVCR